MAFFIHCWCSNRQLTSVSIECGLLSDGFTNGKVNSNSKIGFRTIRFVGEAAALFLRSTRNKGLFHFSGRPAREKYKVCACILSTKLGLLYFTIQSLTPSLAKNSRIA
jgi:hypothetical protein